VNNGKINSFRDLQAWQKSMEFTIAIYRLTQGLPREKVHGLTSQLHRCSFSIPGSIAEGHVKSNCRELRQFTRIAHGSNYELQTQLGIARVPGLEDSSTQIRAEGLSHEVGKTLFTMLGRLLAEAG